MSILVSVTVVDLSPTYEGGARGDRGKWGDK